MTKVDAEYFFLNLSDSLEKIRIVENKYLVVAQAGSAGGVGAAMEARQDPTADGGNPHGPLQSSITDVHVAEVGGAPLGGALGGAPLGGQSSIMDVQVA